MQLLRLCATGWDLASENPFRELCDIGCGSLQPTGDRERF